MNKSTSELKKSIEIWKGKLEYYRMNLKIKTLSPLELLHEIEKWGLMTSSIESLLISVLSLEHRVIQNTSNIYDGSSRYKMKSEYYNIIVSIIKSDSPDYTEIIRFIPENIAYPFNIHKFGDINYLLHTIGIKPEVLYWRRSLENYLFTGKNKMNANFNKKLLRYEKKIESLEDSYRSNRKERVKIKIEELLFTQNNYQSIFCILQKELPSWNGHNP